MRKTTREFMTVLVNSSPDREELVGSKRELRRYGGHYMCRSFVQCSLQPKRSIGYNFFQDCRALPDAKVMKRSCFKLFRV
jgi:hypothetical protein